MISVLGGQAHTHYLIRILFPHHEMKISLCLHSIFFSFALMYRPQKIVWHGSNMKGSKMDEKFCQEWHSQNGNTMGLGYRELDGLRACRCKSCTVWPISPPQGPGRHPMSAIVKIHASQSADSSVHFRENIKSKDYFSRRMKPT